VLSDEFYSEIMNHPIPTDIDAVKVLASAPAVLDLFMWLAYRCFLSRREERIPLFGAFGLTAQLGSIEYTRPRRFRAMPLDQRPGRPPYQIGPSAMHYRPAAALRAHR
jgi:hypothetical protein